MTSRKAILALVLVVSLVAGSWMQSRLNHDRESLGLTRTTIISNAPPVLAFTTVALRRLPITSVILTISEAAVL